MRGHGDFEGRPTIPVFEGSSAVVRNPRFFARLKAKAAIALGDCFAVTTATAHDLPLLTGDPEIIDLADCPCQVEDLRSL
jgi:hypothetical protein